MANKTLPALVVYSRAGCHLCDEMIAGLQGLRERFAFTVEVVDIDGDPALTARYGDDVPVLSADGRDLCHHRLDTGRVIHWLVQRASPTAGAQIRQGPRP